MQLKPFLFVLMLVCAPGTYAKSASASEPVPKNSALDSPLFYEILLGELSARSEEPATAFSLILDAAQKTGDPALFQRAVQIALQARSGRSALQAAKAWSQAMPASAQANQLVLQILLGLNRTAETLVPLKRALTLVPPKEKRALIWSIPDLYSHASDRKLAATTVQRALAGAITDPVLGATAWASIGRLWFSAGDKSAAMRAAAKGLASNVRDEHPALLALSMLDPATPEAERLVKKHLSRARPEFRMAYIKALLSAHRDEDAMHELQSLKSHAPDYADAWLIGGALAMQSDQLEQAQSQLQHFLDLVNATPVAKQSPQIQRERSQAFFSMARIAQQRKDFKQADLWLQRVDSADDLLLAQIRRASLMAQQGQVDQAIELIQRQPERSGDDAQLKRSAEVQILRDQKLFERARDRLQTFISQNPDDLDLVYDLAMVDEKLGNFSEMESSLRALMLTRPADPQAYNALGYSLADRNTRLDEALELINKALQLSPGDPFITDSLAWAEFRRGNVAVALTLLQKVFKEKPDVEIAAHLGEVLWANNQHQQAIEVFKQGIKLNPENETLNQTLQRLRVSL